MSFPQNLSSATGPATPDFVDGDLAALALHMQHCARSHGAMAGLREAFQTGRMMVFGHLVTVAFAAVAVAVAVLAIA